MLIIFCIQSISPLIVLSPHITPQRTCHRAPVARLQQSNIKAVPVRIIKLKATAATVNRPRRSNGFKIKFTECKLFGYVYRSATSA